jgi:CRISPR-associated endoribonuclease Cas2 subtype I-E
MPLIVLDVVCASPKLRGTLSRRYVEMRAGLFIGAASPRMVSELWALVVSESPQCATLAYSARNELGVAFRQYGRCTTTFADCDGLQLAIRGQHRQ